jgi:hypothetical protein
MALLVPVGLPRSLSEEPVDLCERVPSPIAVPLVLHSAERAHRLKKATPVFTENGGEHTCIVQLQDVRRRSSAARGRGACRTRGESGRGVKLSRARPQWPVLAD